MVRNMKKLHVSCCIIILLHFGHSDGVWFGEQDENCQYVNCEGERCPSEEEICPHKPQMNISDGDIRPLSNDWPALSLNVDEKHCEIGNYSQRKLQSIDCLVGTHAVSCNQPQTPGSFVSYKCPDMYQPTGRLPQCQSDGTWSEPISCIPECGVVYPEGVEPLILHGTKVEAGQWPWAAAIFVRESDNTWKFRCGGTLVSDNAIITAAHCVWRRPVKDMFVVLGHLSRKLPTENRKDVIFKVKRIYLLPVYRHKVNKYNSNIAVLILKARLKLTKNILPACLPSNETAVYPYIMSIVSGWGVNENQELSQDLLYMKVPIVDVMKCLKNIQNNLIQFVSYTTFCAGYINGTTACKEDGGGGLLTQHNGKWVLQGVLSSFSHSCHQGSYSVYTKVELYTYWIKLIVNFENSKDVLESAETKINEIE
uniref:Peptidase S1 domain-containing protein n=2 Tax=Graphocephala atropunctata TaxID=36148 RepID=A0A1B6KQM2_9HEMI